MKIFAYRLLPGVDLKEELLRIAKENHLKATIILACVGSLSRASIRMAGASAEKQDIRTYSEEFEIVSAEGTLSEEDMHVHICLSKTDGSCLGGHLKEGCTIKTTVEIVLGEATGLEFLRKEDPDTGFKELSVRSR